MGMGLRGPCRLEKTRVPGGAAARADGPAAADPLPPADLPEDAAVAVLDPAGDLVCLARTRDGDLRPEAVVPVA